MSHDPVDNARVLIVEDEVHSRRYLRELLEAERGISVIGEASDGRQGVELVDSLRPDLVFLDIQLPELDAFEMVAVVGQERMPPLILVTAFAEFALRAFEIEAMDYLIKPYDRNRLQATLKRFFRNRRRSSQTPIEEERSQRRLWRRRLAVKDESTIRFVPVERILWIEAANKYIVVRTADRSYISRQTIQSIVDELSPEHFVRASRSIVVRKNAVSEVKPIFHGDHQILLIDGTELTLSRNYREAFFSQMAR